MVLPPLTKGTAATRTPFATDVAYTNLKHKNRSSLSSDKPINRSLPPSDLTCGGNTTNIYKTNCL